MDYKKSQAYKDRRKKARKARSEMLKMQSERPEYVEKITKRAKSDREDFDKEKAKKDKIDEMKNRPVQGIGKTLKEYAEELSGSVPSEPSHEEKMKMKRRVLRKVASTKKDK